MNANAETCLQQAMKKHQQGDLYDADLLYAQVLQHDPENAQALRLKGILTRERGDIAGSLQLLNKAIHLNPEDAEAVNETAL